MTIRRIAFAAAHAAVAPLASATDSAKLDCASVYSLAWGLPSISFVDGDTNCLVTVTPMGLDKARATAFAGDLEKALTVESAK